MEKPKIRFKGYQEDWEQRKLGEICSRVQGNDGRMELPTLTISAANGWMKQEDRFSGNIAGKEQKNYTLLHKGELSYNHGNSKLAKYGTVFSLQTYEEALVPRVYHSFKVEIGSADFIEYFFATKMPDRELRKLISSGARMDGLLNIGYDDFMGIKMMFPSVLEQDKIAEYFRAFDHLITLHHRKYMKNIDLSLFAWEQRKLSDVVDSVDTGKSRFDKEGSSGEYPILGSTSVIGYDDEYDYEGDFILTARVGANAGSLYRHAGKVKISDNTVFIQASQNIEFLYQLLIQFDIKKLSFGTGQPLVKASELKSLELMMPSDMKEQMRIGVYFKNLDSLITLHHRKQIYVLNTRIYAKTTLIITKEKKKMPELEKVIEDKLIEQLVFGESQWTYREDLKTEEDLWKNFRYILEQNNKARLDGQPLSDAEFEQVKNQLQFSSFYKAGEWLVGENGKAMVHVQRDTEKLHLVVMNHEHIAGGSSVYEVINQYNALKDDDITTVARDRRFDVTLMINGLPMIHIELKNRQHSYMDAFYQIKKYISEGKFTGIFSAVQMFVISNGVDTKYFAAASDTELNPKFMSGWVDTENNPVADYIDFAKNVLRIPEMEDFFQQRIIRR